MSATSASPRLSTDPLLQPLRIRHIAFRNRIMSTSHNAALDEGGLPTERYQRYHEEKAKGGLALTMFGGSAMVAPDSNWGGGQIDLSSDSVIPYFQQFSARIHRHGAAIMCQITHLGRRADAFSANWLPTIGPSRVRETLHRNIPREMDRTDIDRVVRAYAEAAARCKEGGLDGVETLTGGHLIGQFLSPRTNHRTDGFGGCIENRARFGLMVHEAIRRRVGDDFLVGIRFVVDERSSGGLDFADCVHIAHLFERAGHIDFFNAIFGLMDTDIALAEDAMPGMSEPIAFFLDRVGAFRREVAHPVFHAGRILDLATARHAVADGLVDMVGMTRAHVADPQIVNKLSRGEEDRIRPCVGASYCLYKKVTCIHNPATSREEHLPQIVERSAQANRKVVVVGGGPGGLEAARVAAERGHKVVLFEAGSRLGGQLLIATRAASRRDLIGIIDWRVRELERLGVTVRLNTYAGTADVLAEKPDAVIIATGGLPDVDSLEGSEYCTSVWEILSGATTARGDIIVFDGIGRHAAVSCALHLLGTGHIVRFVTIDDRVAIEMAYTERAVYRKRLALGHVQITTDQQLLGVQASGNQLAARFRHDLTGEETTLNASQIVVERGTVPVRELFDDLRGTSANQGITNIECLLAGRPQPRTGSGLELHLIGDAVSSRNVHAAIYDALRLCMVL